MPRSIAPCLHRVEKRHPSACDSASVFRISVAQVKVEQEQLAKLPPTVLTSLLPRGDGAEILRSELASTR
jgi:hypothetical protein